MPPPHQVVLDTNVVVSALRSRRGASFKLISSLGSPAFEISLSVPLLLEYEEILTRQRDALGLTRRDIADFLDYLCRVGHLRAVYFLWRPFLPDPQDAMVLEVALAGGCGFIVTYNKRDFANVERFGICLGTPAEFLILLSAP